MGWHKATKSPCMRAYAWRVRRMRDPTTGQQVGHTIGNVVTRLLSPTTLVALVACTGGPREQAERGQEIGVAAEKFGEGPQLAPCAAQ